MILAERKRTTEIHASAIKNANVVLKTFRVLGALAQAEDLDVLIVPILPPPLSFTH
jgi:hypothetical protein